MRLSSQFCSFDMQTKKKIEQFFSPSDSSARCLVEKNLEEPESSCERDFI